MFSFQVRYNGRLLLNFTVWLHPTAVSSLKTTSTRPKHCSPWQTANIRDAWDVCHIRKQCYKHKHQQSQALTMLTVRFISSPASESHTGIAAQPLCSAAPHSDSTHACVERSVCSAVSASAGLLQNSSSQLEITILSSIRAARLSGI